MKRSAFSLIELLIVVLIVGVVYTLAISNFDNVKENKIKPTLLTLKSSLNELEKKKKAELICLDECKSCNVYIDGEVDGNLSEVYEDFLDEEPKMYRYDQSFGLVRLKNRVVFNQEGIDEEVCFSLSVDRNGVSDQVIVEYKDRFYDFTPYFENTQVYRSGSELTQIKEDTYQEVLR